MGAIHRSVLFGVLVVVLTGCASQPEIYGASASGDGTTLEFEMAACHGDYAVTISQSAEEVRVRITDQRRRTPLSGGDACADGVGPIELDEPLGGRRLIDDAHNVDIPVAYSPWNQTKYSESDYRTAVESAAHCIEELEPDAIVRIVTHPDGHPDLDATLPDLGDGESRQDMVPLCIERHVEPLRR
jgi:hypothetical protein